MACRVMFRQDGLDRLYAGCPGRTVARDIGKLAQNGLRVALGDLLAVEYDEVPEVGVGVQQGSIPRRANALAAVEGDAVEALALLAKMLQGLVRDLERERRPDR